MNTTFKAKLYIYIYMFEIYIPLSLPVYLFHQFFFSDYDIFILPGISVYILFYFFLMYCFSLFSFLILSDIFSSLFWYLFFLPIFFLPPPLGFLLFSFFNLYSCFFSPCFPSFPSFFNFSHSPPWIYGLSLASPVLLNKNYGLCQLIHIYLRKYCIFPSCHSLIFIPGFLWSKRVLSFCS